MKILHTLVPTLVPIALILFTLNSGVQAQGMSEADMQNMMERMNKAQACFDNIDPATFEEMEKKGREMEKEIKSLCKAGNRGKAMSKAIQFSKEFSSSESYAEVQKCAKLMEGMMQQIPMPNLVEDVDNPDNNEHICDSI